MDTTYKRALSEIESTKDRLKKLYDSAPTDKFEDKEACRVLENIMGKLESAGMSLKYYNLNAKTGYLVKQENDKYHIEYDEGDESWQLSCGSPLEAYLDDFEEEGEKCWYVGRVEYDWKKQNYYFVGPGSPELYTGMRVRKRE